MDNSSVNADIIRGHVTTIILKILYDHDCYGYDIIKEIEIKSEGSFKIKQPTLYSILKRLESQGYITSYVGDVSNGGKRRYYSLTTMGRDFLKRDQAEWEYSRTIMNKLLSDKDYDLTTPAPFETEELRPYTKRTKDYADYVSSSKDDYASDSTLDEELAEYVPESNYSDTDLEKEVLADNTEQSLQNEVAPIVQNEKSAPALDYSAVNNYDEPLTRTANYNYESLELPDLTDEPNPEELESTPEINTEESTFEDNKLNDDYPSVDELIHRALEDAVTTDDVSDDLYTTPQREYAPTFNAAASQGNTSYARDNLEEPIKKAPVDDNSDDSDYSYSQKMQILFSEQKHHPLPKREEQPVSTYSPINIDDLSTKLYSEGYKLVKYNKANSNSYYTMSSYYVNKLLMATSWLTYLAFALEIAIFYFVLYGALGIDSSTYLYILAGCLLIPITVTVIYLLNPKKRIKAQFDLKQSLFNTFTIYLFLVVIVTLVGFFIIGNTAITVKSLVKPVFLPILLLLNIPLSSVLYSALYSTNRYHLK